MDLPNDVWIFKIFLNRNEPQQSINADEADFPGLARASDLRFEIGSVVAANDDQNR
jgi:hypothetical protein